jgi:membrane protease YdiL (CAAX protease family)
VFPGHVEEYINKKYFTTILEMILWGFHIIFLGASVEEFFFRGLISQKWALKWGVKTGILSSSLLFAIYHFRFDIIPLFLMGVMYSVLYFKTRNLFTTILCHLFHNATVVTWNATEYFSQSPVQRSAFITLKDYQNSIQPLLGQKIFLIAITAPFLIYFIYKNFPRNDAIISYKANEN